MELEMKFDYDNFLQLFGAIANSLIIQIVDEKFHEFLIL